MKNKELYDKTVDILVQAYFNDTLDRGNYCGCAVGNIIASNCGMKMSRDEFNRLTWDGNIESGAHWWRLIKNDPDANEIIALQQCTKTGYNIKELQLIEESFEDASWWNINGKDWMFSGLCAVIEALDIIHENTDEEVTKVSKQRFVKA